MVEKFKISLTLDALKILESFDNIFEQYWISNYALQLTLKTPIDTNLHKKLYEFEELWNRIR